MMACELCNGRGTIGPVRASVHYMHDNHTFTKLAGSLNEIVDKAREIAIESTGGMLGRVSLLDAEGKETRRVGLSIHSRASGFSEADLIAWRDAVAVDHEAIRLFGGAPTPCPLCAARAEIARLISESVTDAERAVLEAARNLAKQYQFDEGPIGSFHGPGKNIMTHLKEETLLNTARALAESEGK